MLSPHYPLTLAFTIMAILFCSVAGCSDESETVNDVVSDAPDTAEQDLMADTDAPDASDVPADEDAEDDAEVDSTDATDVEDGQDAETTDAGDVLSDDMSTDPCAERPPLNLTSGFSMFYSNANPTEEVFIGTTPWTDAFEMPFPDDSGAAKRIQLQRDHYAVIAFDTFDLSSTSGRFQTENPQITQRTGSKLISISECPGDFSTPAEDPDCLRSLGPAGSFGWNLEDQFAQCQLERDRQYYLNIVFTEDEALPLEWVCSIVPDADDCMMLFVTIFN